MIVFHFRRGSVQPQNSSK